MADFSPIVEQMPEVEGLSIGEVSQIKQSIASRRNVFLVAPIATA